MRANTLPLFRSALKAQAEPSRSSCTSAYRYAIAAGATTSGYPDTVGILTPDGSYGIPIVDIRRNVELKGARLAVHFHNDLGLATANTLAAIRAGTDVVQCTVNGMGERAGNASLEEVVIALSLNERTYGCRPKIDTVRLTALSRLVAEETGIDVPSNKPITGRSVFSSGAGLHQDGLLKDPHTYLPFSPTLVGVDSVELVLGRHSGRAAAAAYLKSFGRSTNRESVECFLAELKTDGSTRFPPPKCSSMSVESRLQQSARNL